MKSKKSNLKEFDALTVEEQYEALGVKGIPESSWRKEVRGLSAVELINMHRRELRGARCL